MTKAELVKIAKANGIDMTNIKVSNSNGTVRIEMKDLPADLAKANIKYHANTNDQLPEVERMIRAYNRAASKLSKVVASKCWGLKYGDGTWMYEFGSQSYSSKLALSNID